MQILCSWVLVDLGLLSLAWNCFGISGITTRDTVRLQPCVISATTATKLPEKWIYFFELSSSLLAVSLFLSECQAPARSGKRIIVVKWALSKHPCGGATPVHALARDWGRLWAPAAPVLQSGCAYTDSRWYLIIWLYMGTNAYRRLWYTFTPGGAFMGIHWLSWTTARCSKLQNLSS